MKNLKESILEGILDIDDTMDKADKQVEKYAKTKILENFIRDYFEKLYKEEFINIRELRRENVNKENGNPGRDVLVKDDYSFNSWKSDYRTFKTKIIALSKKLRVILDFDDDDLNDIDIYVECFPGVGSFLLADFNHIKPGYKFFVWRESNPDNGGVKLALYAIDRCKLR